MTKFIGRGLGLAAVARIVQSHQGNIDLASILGKNDDVGLPASNGRTGRRSARARKIQIDEFENGNILVADDQASIRDLAGHILAGIGFEVVLSASDEDAVAYLSAIVISRCS